MLRAGVHRLAGKLQRRFAARSRFLCPGLPPALSPASPRLATLRAVLAGLVLAALPMAQAQSNAAGAAPAYPERPIRMVVPFAVGGTSDVLARLIGQHLGEALGQQVVIDNRPGANGNIGSDLVAKAAPDGYTLLLVADGTMVINPSLYPTLPFDPARDFAPVSRVAMVPLIIVAHPSLKADSPAELIELGRSDAASLFFASAGPGSMGHLAGELLKIQSGLKMSHVAYKGGGQAITDVVAGQVPLLVTALATAGPFLKDGRLKAVAVTSGKRVSGAPQVATVAESGVSGVAGFDVSSWYGIVAPKGTPEPIVRRLHAEVTRILQSPQTRERLETLGAEPIGDSPEQFAAVIRDDLARWAKVVKDANISFK